MSSVKYKNRGNNSRYFSRDFNSKSLKQENNGSKKQSKQSPYYSNDVHSKSRKQWKNKPGYQSKQSTYYSNDELVEPRTNKRKYKGTETCVHIENSPDKKRKGDNETKNDHYFSSLLAVFEKGFDDEEAKEMFLSNLLEKIIDQEVKLSCQKTGSQCIELILEDCKNPNVIIRFMKAFSENLDTVFLDKYASHISQKLLCIGLKMMESPTSGVHTSVDREGTHIGGDDIQCALVFYICKFGKCCCNEFYHIIGHRYASHVLRTCIQVLGYYFVDKSISQSKRSLFQKEQLSQKSYDFDFAALSKEETSNIPKRFLVLLKKIIENVLENEEIKDYLNESKPSSVIQTLLLVAKQRLPEYASRLVKHLSSKVFSDSNDQSFPSALILKTSSYTFEKIFEVANEEQQHTIWTQMNQHLDYLVQHPIANYFIQRLFDMVQDKKLFEVMVGSTVVHFDKIQESQKYGIWMSMAKACNRLCAQQALFMKTLMECLECLEPEHRRIHFASLVLRLQKYGSLERKKALQFSPTDVRLHGSLILQELLKFHKPIKVVTSIINMKPEELGILACHIQGCHVFTRFFESTSVGEKNRGKLIHQLKPAIVSIANDDSGSLTLSKIWFLLSLRQRGVIADMLSQNQKTLIQKRCALNLLKKCAVFHYKHNLKEWEQIQNKMSKKKHFLKEIIGD